MLLRAIGGRQTSWKMANHKGVAAGRRWADGSAKINVLHNPTGCYTFVPCNLRKVFFVPSIPRVAPHINVDTLHNRASCVCSHNVAYQNAGWPYKKRDVVPVGNNPCGKWRIRVLMSDRRQRELAPLHPNYYRRLNIEVWITAGELIIKC